jgi:hypothetical protein
MGLAALAAAPWCARIQRLPVPEMEPLLNEIGALIGEPGARRDDIERTLTDGYAHALSLEAEQWRLQKRMEQITQSLQEADHTEQARELAALAQRLDGNAVDLTKLRAVLADLRRHADRVSAA